MLPDSAGGIGRAEERLPDIGNDDICIDRPLLHHVTGGRNRDELDPGTIADAVIAAVKGNPVRCSGDGSVVASGRVVHR